MPSGSNRPLSIAQPLRSLARLCVLAVALQGAGCFIEEEPDPTNSRPHVCTEFPNPCGDMALVSAGALCVPNGEAFTCDCPAPGLRLSATGRCEDVRECDEFGMLAMCGPEAMSCSNTTGSFSCRCNAGFVTDGVGTPCRSADDDCPAGFAPTGFEGKCEDINECRDFDLVTNCGTAATGCNNTIGNYNCVCPNGYRTDGPGTVCRVADNNCQPGFAPTGRDGACEDINECQQNGCGAGSVSCLNFQGYFECRCGDGYVGGGRSTPCTPAENNCERGFLPTGPQGACQDVNECARGTLAEMCGLEGTQCVNTSGSWECRCARGFKAPGPEEHCAIAPNNCADGYLPTGANGLCEDVNECTSYGLLVACGPEGTSCRNTVGGHECGCTRGFRQNNPGEACRPAENICQPGYAPTGLNGACENIRECDMYGLDELCGTGAQRCSDTVGSYECFCIPGYRTNGRGTPCEEIPNNCQPGFAPTGTNGACQDINECTVFGTAAMCGTVATGCSNTPSGSFTCSCPSGYQTGGPGTPCVDSNPCGTQSVETLCGVATATCEPRPGSFFCNCPAGYTNQIISGNTTGNGTKCVDINECLDPNHCEAICTNTPGSSSCVSTVADSSSPYWPYYCWTPDQRYASNATNFELDCRCGTLQMNRPDDTSHPHYEPMMRCDRVLSLEERYYGTGISVQRWRRRLGADTAATRWNGGYLDHGERKIYMGAQWKDNTATDGNPELTYYGAVIAVDVNWNGPTVGNRTLVSGHTLEGDRGTGPTLRAVWDIKKGPDGKLYTVSYESGHPVQFMRIDQATGNRTLVWKAADIFHGEPMPASQCHNGSRVGFDQIYNGNRYSLQYPQAGTNLAMAENGDFFLPIMQSGPAKGPKGIVRISADGSRCEWVTRFAATSENIYAPKPEGQRGADYGLPTGTGPRGAGPINYGQNPANIFYHRDSSGVPWIYVMDGIASGAFGNRYYRVNVDTGDRFDLFSDVVGDTYSEWDPSRQVLWTAGAYDRTRIVAVDILGLGGEAQVLGGIRCLSTNSDWYQCMRGPGDVGNAARADIMFDPYDNNLVMVHERQGLVRVEVRTGNTYTFSK